MAPPTTITGSLEGMDHDAGIAIEAGRESSRVDCDEDGVGAGEPPSRVTLSVITGGVSAATAFPPFPESGARQFEQVAAPGELRVLQCGQSIAKTLICPLELLRVCVSHWEIKACGVFWCPKYSLSRPSELHSRLTFDAFLAGSIYFISPAIGNFIHLRCARLDGTPCV
jgi:hypothetical protein